MSARLTRALGWTHALGLVAGLAAAGGSVAWVHRTLEAAVRLSGRRREAEKETARCQARHLARSAALATLVDLGDALEAGEEPAPGRRSGAGLLGADVLEEHRHEVDVRRGGEGWELEVVVRVEDLGLFAPPPPLLTLDPARTWLVVRGRGRARAAGDGRLELVDWTTDPPQVETPAPGGDPR